MATQICQQCRAQQKTAQLRRYQTGGGVGATCVSKTVSKLAVISVAGAFASGVQFAQGSTETSCGADLEKQFDTTNRSCFLLEGLSCHAYTYA